MAGETSQGHAAWLTIGAGAVLTGMGVIATNALATSPSGRWYWVGLVMIAVGVVTMVAALCHQFRHRLWGPRSVSPPAAPIAPPSTDPLPPRPLRLSPEGIDLDEVIYEEPVSGRVWRYGEVSALNEPQRRELEKERPAVTRAYRDRLFRNVIVPEASWPRTASARMALGGLIADGDALLQVYRDMILLNPPDRATRGRELERDALYWRNRAVHILVDLGLNTRAFLECSPQTTEPLTPAQLECHVERLKETGDPVPVDFRPSPELQVVVTSAVQGQRITVVIENVGPTDEFVGQVIRITGQVGTAPPVPWSVKWLDWSEERQQILRGAVRALELAEGDPTGEGGRYGRLWFFRLSGRLEFWLGDVRSLDRVPHQQITLLLRIASVGTGVARHFAVRFKFDRNFHPKVSLHEARSKTERHTDRVIFTDADTGREYRWSYVAGLGEDEKKRLAQIRPEVWRAFELEENNRMGPPGQPGGLWDDEY